MELTLYGIDPHNYPMSDQLPNPLIVRESSKVKDKPLFTQELLKKIQAEQASEWAKFWEVNATKENN